MPDFGIVDTHVHLWDTANLAYPWLDEIPQLNRPYMPETYAEAVGDLPVERIVFMEADVAHGSEVEEARWVASLASREPRLEGIVASAPLEGGAQAAETLERLAEIPLVKGVRRLIQTQPPGYCVQPGFIEGVRLLEGFGLSFDICINHTQMEDAAEMVRQCPGVRFILDHVGKPDIAGGMREPWWTGIRNLAAFENVHCKVSGMATEADTERWRPEDLKPYVDHVIDSFGPDRVIFGSDWPVVLLAAEYGDWVEALRWAMGGASDADLRKLFRDNATRFYRLRSPTLRTNAGRPRLRLADLVAGVGVG